MFSRLFRCLMFHHIYSLMLPFIDKFFAAIVTRCYDAALLFCPFFILRRFVFRFARLADIWLLI